jgi:alcohol dehydrogenase
MSQIVKFGTNSLDNLENFLKEKNPKSIFLVTGKNSYLKCGAKIKLDPILKNYKHIRFFDFEENPKIQDVEKGILLFNEHNCDLTIAIGGGSAIDIAKLINSLSNIPNDLEETIKSNRLEQRPFPFVAIPTTAGTGSEATHFAVMYINGEKYSFAHKYILPDYVIINSEFTYSTPAYLTACTGADAFCQAMESMWATGGSAESKGYAEKAIILVWNNLVEAVVNNNYAAKDAVMEGAYWAGKAINISKTTASHALSYKMTSLFNVPHGHAVAITLVNVMKVNYDYAKEDIQQILSLISAEDLSDGVLKIKNFWHQIGLCMKLSQLGIEESQISKLSNCNLERLKNNPALLSKDFIEKLFRSLI